MGRPRKPQPADVEHADRKPWERRPGETSQAFAAFRHYCKLGMGRSLGKTAFDLKKTPNMCEKWSRRHQWVDRARDWDTHMAEVEQARQEKVRAEFADRWERRRLEAAEANWDRAQRLALRAEEMLKSPLYEQEITQEIIDPATGERRPVAITLTPAKWTFGAVAQLLKTVAELQAAALAEALGGADDGFDPETATPEECRAYVAKHGITALPAPAPRESAD